MDGFRKAQDQGGMSGGFFFEYFPLATQKKVSRLSGRQIGRIADLHAKHPEGGTHGCVS